MPKKRARPVELRIQVLRRNHLRRHYPEAVTSSVAPFPTVTLDQLREAQSHSLFCGLALIRDGQVNVEAAASLLDGAEFKENTLTTTFLYKLWERQEISFIGKFRVVERTLADLGQYNIPYFHECSIVQFSTKIAAAWFTEDNRKALREHHARGGYPVTPLILPENPEPNLHRSIVNCRQLIRVGARKLLVATRLLSFLNGRPPFSPLVHTLPDWYDYRRPHLFTFKGHLRRDLTFELSRDPPTVERLPDFVVTTEFKFVCNCRRSDGYCLLRLPTPLVITGSQPYRLTLEEGIRNLVKLESSLRPTISCPDTTNAERRVNGPRPPGLIDASDLGTLLVLNTHVKAEPPDPEEEAAAAVAKEEAEKKTAEEKTEEEEKKKEESVDPENLCPEITIKEEPIDRDEEQEQEETLVKGIKSLARESGKDDVTKTLTVPATPSGKEYKPTRLAVCIGPIGTKTSIPKPTVLPPVAKSAKNPSSSSPGIRLSPARTRSATQSTPDQGVAKGAAPYPETTDLAEKLIAAYKKIVPAPPAELPARVDPNPPPDTSSQPKPIPRWTHDEDEEGLDDANPVYGVKFPAPPTEKINPHGYFLRNGEIDKRRLHIGKLGIVLDRCVREGIETEGVQRSLNLAFGADPFALAGGEIPSPRLEQFRRQIAPFGGEIVRLPTGLTAVFPVPPGFKPFDKDGKPLVTAAVRELLDKNCQGRTIGKGLEETSASAPAAAAAPPAAAAASKAAPGAAQRRDTATPKTAAAAPKAAAAPAEPNRSSNAGTFPSFLAAAKRWGLAVNPDAPSFKFYGTVYKPAPYTDKEKAIRFDNIRVNFALTLLQQCETVATNLQALLRQTNETGWLNRLSNNPRQRETLIVDIRTYHKERASLYYAREADLVTDEEAQPLIQALEAVELPIRQLGLQYLISSGNPAQDWRPLPTEPCLRGKRVWGWAQTVERSAKFRQPGTSGAEAGRAEAPAPKRQAP